MEDSLMRHLPLAVNHGSESCVERSGWLERLRKGPPAEGTAATVALELLTDVGVL